MTKTRQWLFLGAAAALAVVLLGWFLVIAPTQSHAAELTEQAEAQAVQTATLTRQLQVLRAQAAELPDRQARLAELQQELPETVALPELVRLLTAAGDDTGVEIDSIAPGAPVASGAIAEVPVTLVVSGPFYNQQQFLGALEDLPRAFFVAGFSLTPKGEGGRDLQMSVTGKVFTKQMPAGAAGTAAAGTGGTAADGAATGGTGTDSDAQVVDPATGVS